MCGEQPRSLSDEAYERGSPPRVRGTVHPAFPDHRGHGITPACAGNRRRCRRTCIKSQDHPRVCGEQMTACIDGRGLAGSPPRVRGTDTNFGNKVIDGGITPACAGNSFFNSLCQLLFWDHPRVCGEQRLAVPVLFTAPGSPPRVRGTANTGNKCRLNIGITPACAGNSSRGDMSCQTE